MPRARKSNTNYQTRTDRIDSLVARGALEPTHADELKRRIEGLERQAAIIAGRLNTSPMELMNDHSEFITCRSKVHRFPSNGIFGFEPVTKYILRSHYWESLTCDECGAVRTCWRNAFEYSDHTTYRYPVTNRRGQELKTMTHAEANVIINLIAFDSGIQLLESGQGKAARTA